MTGIVERLRGSPADNIMAAGEAADTIESLRAEVARLSAPVDGEMSDAVIDKILSTHIPGGSSARDWFLPHESEKALSNVRDVVRRMFSAQMAQLRNERDAAIKALTPKPPREGIYPWAVELEPTANHAQYWIDAGRAEANKGHAVLAVEQAVNSWKNACYHYAEKLTAANARIAELEGALKVAGDALALGLRQNEHDMLLTGDECRVLSDAITKISEATK